MSTSSLPTRSIAVLLAVALLIPSIRVSAQESASPPSEPEQTESTEVAPEADQGMEESPAETSEETQTTEEPVAEETLAPAEVATSTPTVEESAVSTTTTTDAVVEESTVETTMASSTDPLATTTESVIEEPKIESGRAIALANILNLVNSNFVNSNGVFVFSNFFDHISGTLDFRNYYESLAGLCDGAPCTHGDSVEVRLSNDARIENDIVVRASSGENEITGAESGTIETGDAYAGLNLINMANTSVVDSSYLLVTLNAFAGVDGDIVFPSLQSFFNSIAEGASSPRTVDITSTATVENTVSVDAESGGNTTDSTENSSITSGDSHAVTNVFNQLNTSLVGDRSVTILFRVHGDWVGDVFGAPDELSWMEGPDGSVFLFDTASAGPGGGIGNAVDMTASSTALIENDVSVVALTGDNHISGADTALISTGDAYAGANIVNIANGTVVGRNWILAVVNIFGNFNGNIAFGRPDLWVGEQVDVPSSVINDSVLTYTFTVINNGDSVATETMLVDDYEENYLEIIEADYPYTTDGDVLTFALGELPPGAATEVSYRARVVSVGYDTDITNTVTVTERETDNNLSDNTDTATVRTDSRSSSGSERNETRVLERPTGTLSPRELTVTRTTPQTTVTSPNSSVHQTIVLTNTNSRASLPITLRDVLRDPSGAVVREEPWVLGSVYPGEEITVSYDVVFSDSAVDGTYTLSTYVDGPEDNDAVYENNGTVTVDFVSEESAMPSMILGTEEVREQGLLDTLIPTAHASEGLVAGAATARASYPYLLGLTAAAVGAGFIWWLFFMRKRRRENEGNEG